VIEKGQQAIVLIPEIALTPQTVERFTSRFGDQVAVLHSRLSPGERTLQWRRMALGEAKVAVGARSALFAPAKNLGLIVVDEEHESSYKQDKSPRYHARDAAVMRAQIGKAVALLGSATPSLESVHNARTGKYSFLAMPDRVNQRPLPKIKLINLREEWQVRGQDRPVLSMALEAAIRETLEKKEQVLLFLNRRGFNTLTLCMKCGEQVHCPNCSVPVTFHRGLTVKGKPALLCHYCDWKGPVPEKCPQCLDGDIQQVGLGTEKVEEEMKAKFPGARIGRMDLDTTRKQGSHEDIITRFRNHEIDLLVGTQMIAKGHDFPGVTLVGIVGADTGLALPDFRSSEKVFQLLVQVAGRAGRAEKEGIIYLQTFNPDHAAIQAAQRHDTGGFWKNELELRQALNYPPFCRLAILMYQSPDEKKAREAAEKVGQLLDKAAPAYQVQVLGPAPAAMFKLQSNYRFQILLKAAKASSIRQLIQNLDSRMTVPSGVLRVVDIDPQSML
jgi:primosomal protein N' (replication factor Y)